jgi:hypothetical protein
MTQHTCPDLVNSKEWEKLEAKRRHHCLNIGVRTGCVPNRNYFASLAQRISAGKVDFQ